MFEKPIKTDFDYIPTSVRCRYKYFDNQRLIRCNYHPLKTCYNFVATLAFYVSEVAEGLKIWEDKQVIQALFMEQFFYYNSSKIWGGNWLPALRFHRLCVLMCQMDVSLYISTYLLYDIKNRHRPLCVLLSTYTHAQLPLPEPIFSFKIDITRRAW